MFETENDIPVGKVTPVRVKLRSILHAIIPYVHNQEKLTKPFALQNSVGVSLPMTREGLRQIFSEARFPILESLKFTRTVLPSIIHRICVYTNAAYFLLNM